MNLSDVAKTRQQIELEREAAIGALKAPAVVANHAAITARMERMTVHIQALVKAGLHKEAEMVCTSDDLWT
jgi:hypothetical protein